MSSGVGVEPLPRTLRELFVPAAAWGVVVAGRLVCRVVQAAIPLTAVYAPLDVDDARRLLTHRIR